VEVKPGYLGQHNEDITDVNSFSVMG